MGAKRRSSLQLLQLLLLPLAFARALPSGADAAAASPDRQQQQQPPLVKTEKGALRGLRHSVLGVTVDEYLGVPYARPPVGRLRFRRPVPSGPWSGVYNATRRPNSCWQPDDSAFGDFVGSMMWNANTPRSEDCLYLNVWAPAPGAGGGKLPVMVWIYGGGFNSGTSTLDLYDGKYLAAAGRVVVVSMNYRIGLLGFLALHRGRPASAASPASRAGDRRGYDDNGEDDSARGNMGLYDVLLALRWVSANVERFGGDPHSVTLFGESAGSAIVSALLVSPLAASAGSSGNRDLFHRAILQSGTILADWATMTPENADQRYRQIFAPDKIDCNYGDDDADDDDDGDSNDIDAEAAGDSPAAVSGGGSRVGRGSRSSSTEALIACLRTKDAADLTRDAFFTGDLMQFPFLPTVDGELLVESPRAALAAGRFKRCPLLVGSNANEGSYWLAYLPPFATSHNRSEIDFAIGRAAYRDILERAFESYPQWPHPLGGLALDAIAYRYTNWLRPDDTVSNRRALDDAVGDYHFVCPSNRWADTYVTLGADAQQQQPLPVYYYRYAHVSSRKPWGRWTGAMHADELHYVFGEPLRAAGGGDSGSAGEGERYTDEERHFSEQIIAMWTNFARTGDPARESESAPRQWDWPRRTATGFEYFELTPEALRSRSGVVGAGPRADYCAFWEHYLPGLVAATVSMEDAERDWKLQYNEWKTRYMVDWRDQFQAFVKNGNRFCRRSTSGEL